MSRVRLQPKLIVISALLFLAAVAVTPDPATAENVSAIAGAAGLKGIAMALEIPQSLSLEATKVARPFLLDRATFIPPHAISEEGSGQSIYPLEEREGESQPWHRAPDDSGVFGSRPGSLEVRAAYSTVEGVLAGYSNVVSVKIENGRVPGWLRELNAYRALAGSEPLAENPRFDHGDELHVRYMLHTFELSHEEKRSSDWYTKAGAEAGLSSDLSEGDPHPVSGLIAAPFHALSMLDPDATLAGFAASPPFAAIWPGSESSNRNHDDAWEFPGPGSVSPIGSEAAGESPNPVAGCPRRWGARFDAMRHVGLPIIASFTSEPRQVKAVLKEGGGRLQVCVVTRGNFRERYGWQEIGREILAGYHAVFVIPLLPLRRNRRYSVHVVSQGQPALRWTFKVK